MLESHQIFTQCSKLITTSTPKGINHTLDCAMVEGCWDQVFNSIQHDKSVPLHVGPCSIVPHSL